MKTLPSQTSPSPPSPDHQITHGSRSHRRSVSEAATGARREARRGGSGPTCRFACCCDRGAGPLPDRAMLRAAPGPCVHHISRNNMLTRAAISCRSQGRAAAHSKRASPARLGFAAPQQKHTQQSRRSCIVRSTPPLATDKLPEDDPRMILRISQGTSFMGLLAARRAGARIGSLKRVGYDVSIVLIDGNFVACGDTNVTCESCCRPCCSSRTGERG